MELAKGFWALMEPVRKHIPHYLISYACLQAMWTGTGAAIAIIIKLQESDASRNLWTLFFLAIILSKEISTRIDARHDFLISSRFDYPNNRGLKSRVMRKMMWLDSAWHVNNNSGEQIGRVYSGISDAYSLMNHLLWNLCPTIVRLIIAGGVLLAIAPWYIAAIAVSGFIGFGFSAHKSAVKTNAYRERVSDLEERESRMMTEIVQNQEIIVAFGQEENSVAMYERILEDVERVRLESRRVDLFRFA